MPAREPFTVVDLDAVPPGPDRGPGIAELKPVRRHLGIQAFGANGRVAREAGEVVVLPHDERADGSWGTDGHEELYVVLRGAARFTLDGREVDVPAGSLLFIRDPAVVRSAVATVPDTAILAVGAPAGAPFRVAAWEQRDIDARQG